MKQYELLQYDILFGDRHAYGDMKNKIVNPNYFLGFGPIVIDRITPDSIKAGTETPIKVSGQNIPALGKLFANGKALETKWEKDGQLSAKLPADALKSGSCDLQVKLFDSKDIVIGESNVFKLQAPK